MGDYTRLAFVLLVLALPCGASAWLAYEATQSIAGALAGLVTSCVLMLSLFGTSGPRDDG